MVRNVGRRSSGSTHDEGTGSTCPSDKKKPVMPGPLRRQYDNMVDELSDFPEDIAEVWDFHQQVKERRLSKPKTLGATVFEEWKASLYGMDDGWKGSFITSVGDLTADDIKAVVDEDPGGVNVLLGIGLSPYLIGGETMVIWKLAQPKPKPVQITHINGSHLALDWPSNWLGMWA